jgi:hypothetical protein
MQGTINTLTIFNRVATFTFASGILTSINASHVVVRSANGKTSIGVISIGSVVAPDVFVGGKVGANQGLPPRQCQGAAPSACA